MAVVWFGIGNKPREATEVKRLFQGSGNRKEKMVRTLSRGKELHVRVCVPFEEEALCRSSGSGKMEFYNNRLMRGSR